MADLSKTRTTLEKPNNPTSGDLRLRRELHRLFTFPLESKDIHKPFRTNLAKSGFFLTENKDTVQCFFCKKLINLNIILTSGNHEMYNNHECTTRTENVSICDPNYRYESDRLYSFYENEWSYAVSAYALARAGFYYPGVNDTCRCFFCRVEVKSWDANDDPDKEHKKWNPACMFVNKRHVGNVWIGKEQHEQDEVKDDRVIPSSADENKPIQNTAVLASKTATKPILRRQDYADQALRKKSFENWPTDLNPRPEILVQAGFYYTGVADRVICYQCGLGLEAWAGSCCPWIEHKKWAPKCPVLKERNIEEGCEIEAKLKTTTINEELDAPMLDHKPSSTRGKKLKTCRLCNNNTIAALYLPCTHLISCTQCVNIEKYCRICNKQIVAFVTVQF